MVPIHVASCDDELRPLSPCSEKRGVIAVTISPLQEEKVRVMAATQLMANAVTSCCCWGITLVTVVLAVSAIAGADYSTFVIFIPQFVIAGLVVCCMTCIICCVRELSEDEFGEKDTCFLCVFLFKSSMQASGTPVVVFRYVNVCMYVGMYVLCWREWASLFPCRIVPSSGLRRRTCERFIENLRQKADVRVLLSAIGVKLAVVSVQATSRSRHT